MPFDTLPPWQQLPYFWPARSSYYSATGNVDRVVDPDPMRVLIVFASTQTGFLIGPDKSIQWPYQGIQFNNSQLWMIVDHATFGPLVNGEWYAVYNNPGSILSIYTLSLAKWPQQRTAPQPPPQPPWYQRALNALRGQM